LAALPIRLPVAQRGGAPRTPSQLRTLQRTIGNRRVGGLLRSVGDTATSRGLEPSVRAEMESRFDRDLSAVRIHTDAPAAAAAEAMNAAAYTVGPDLSFAPGRYAPQTPAGRELLAHELTHYVQQTSPARTAVGGPSGDQLASAPAGRGPAAEIEADRNAAQVAAGAHAQVNVAAPVGVAKKDAGDPSDRPYWFQSKPPEKPVTTGAGIEITPKGQVALDPSVKSVNTKAGTFQVQFAGLDSDFQDGKPTATFADAENAVLTAITGAIGDLGELPEIKGAASMAAALAERNRDETVRARLKEAQRSLFGKTLNIFIATDLSVAERLSKAPLGLSTAQIFVRPGDIGDPKKLEAGIRVPLIALMGGERGISVGPGGQLKATTAQALTAEQAKEALLHEMVHVLLINKGISAVQVWQRARPSLVSGPPEAAGLAEDVLFRYVRAQEEIFVYSAIADLYSAFAANKDRYVLYTQAVEAFLGSIGAKLKTGKPVNIDVAEKIGEGKKKTSVKWSISYTLPKSVTVGEAQVADLKQLQEFDIGS
jgi:hypothetical protein